MTDSTQRAIRVLLVDDHETMLWGLGQLIDSAKPRLMLVGKASTAAQALSMTAAVHPDVIVLDLDLGDHHGLDALPHLLGSGARIIVLTGVRDQSQLDRAMLAGARGVVRKTQPPATILKAIERVHEGELWVDRSAIARMFVELSQSSARADSAKERNKIARLTARERHIVRVLAREPGMSIVQIAREQHISERTLRNQLTSIYAKLEVSSRIELNVYASKHQLD